MLRNHIISSHTNNKVTLRGLWDGLLSVWFSIMNIRPTIAGFLGPGRITLRAQFGGALGGVVTPRKS